MKYVLIICLMIFTDGSSAWRRFFRGRSRERTVFNKDYKLTDDLWFQQELDHFDPTNTQSWHQVRYFINISINQSITDHQFLSLENLFYFILQRYFVNSNFYKRGGPVFLMIGGESEASAKWMAEGQWIEYAKQFRAMCFQLEHRFYGKSHPTQCVLIF